MSEKLYGCLLRLFPARFRQAYAEEAILLVRDRVREERGFFLTLRLWLDLLIDFAVSVPRQHYHASQASQYVQTSQSGDLSLWFRAGETAPPRPVALLFGGVLSLATLGTVPALINHFGNSRLPGAPAIQSRRASLAVLGFRKLHAPQSNRNDPGRRLTEGETLDGAEKQRVIDGVIANLKAHYIYPDLADQIADALLKEENAGKYGGIADGAGFAAVLTSRMRNVSHDMHLEVVFMRQPLPSRSTGPNPESLARYREAMQENNCTFEKAQVLPGNIGYLKLNSFPDPSVCGSTARLAMASLNSARAVIFDLRDNRGGFPGMVMLIASYLFDHPEYMYNPRENTTDRLWTRSPVPGNKLADKPAYVLTSARTSSGAEHFSYDLKMLKRATLVGETTGGATDVGTFHRIDDHFGIGIRETRTINPYSEPDWAVVGVQPNLKVRPAEALKVAEKLAEQKLLTTKPSATR